MAPTGHRRKGLPTKFEFDEVGNTVASMDARGHATYFAYDSRGMMRPL